MHCLRSELLTVNLDGHRNHNSVPVYVRCRDLYFTHYYLTENVLLSISTYFVQGLDLGASLFWAGLFSKRRYGATVCNNICRDSAQEKEELSKETRMSTDSNLFYK